MANKLIWGRDLYKGFKVDKNNLMTGNLDDIKPFQLLTQEEKTIDWIKAVADFYETAGWNNVERKAAKIQRNYMMRYGKLNPSDYIVGPDNEFSNLVGWIVPQENTSPLEQFYPLAPNFVDVMRGEFIKRDNTWTIEAIDPYSQAEMFRQKEEGFRQVILQMAQLEKQQTLASMGITEEIQPDVYAQEMEIAMKHLEEVELKSKNFRTSGVKWAEKVLKIHEKRYNLHELEPDGFESGLISDSEYWHIDLLEDDFKLELLNPKWCDYHKGPDTKYVSDGDYFLWFNFMSTGDIINKYGRRMKEEDILKLRDIYARTANLLVPDSMKAMQGAYYDLTKPWLEATDLNPRMNDALLGKELAYNYMRTPNFDHNIDTDIFDPKFGRAQTGHPQMFRVMRLYWRSFQKIGWLTKINRDGSRDEPQWVDENYRVTLEPVYDKSITKEESKDNLLFGEHIDWTWVPQWRHIIKISPNHKHTFWIDNQTDMQSIYIDGAPVKFQFKGKDNPFDSLPPVEGCHFSYINTEAHGFIDRIRPIQIVYNLCMNRVPRKFLEDYGNKVAIDTRMYPITDPSNSADKIDPREDFEDRLRDSNIIEYKINREALDGLGQPPMPQVIALSTVNEAALYFRLGQEIKMEAGELIGISRNRLGQNKASDTATGVQQGIVYSETQTEKYYEQHSNLMQRVRQRMLDAAQYYSTFQQNSREVYMNEMEENVFLDIEGMENLLPHYNIYLQSKANVRAALQTISQFLQNENTLPIKASAKIEALVATSVPTMLRMIRESELEQEIKEAEAQKAQMEQQQAALEAQQKMQAEKLANENAQAELDRQRDIDVATIRALGGIQTDNNKDGQSDAQVNLDNHFRQQEINDSRKNSQDKMNMDRQNTVDKLTVEREKAQKELEKEKVKGEYALKVAKENQVGERPKKK